MIVLKATQSKVLAVLQSVAGIVERKHTLPILANVMLRKTGSTVQLTVAKEPAQVDVTVILEQPKLRPREVFVEHLGADPPMDTDRVRDPQLLGLPGEPLAEPFDH